MSDFLTAAAERLDRMAAEAEAAAVEYGVQVGPNMYERYEDGVLISSFVVEGEHGTVVYRLIGLSFAEAI